MEPPSNKEIVIIEERITKVNGDFHIKKYEKGQFLGKGGFAKVYQFTNLENNKVLAGKIVAKANLTKGLARQKLMSEIRLHKSLFHQNIVKFEHVFEDQNNVYILLELCENQSLNDLVKKRKHLTEIEIQCYVIQIIDGLKYLHSNKIIHRDLKAGNVFLNNKMQIKLGDFGLAAQLEFHGERKRTVCGTPNYLAPEILNGNSGHSFQVDVWALGVLIYYLLYGKAPFETNDVKSTCKKIKANEYTFPDIPQVSESAKDLINKILIQDPQKRLTLDEILQHPFINNGGLIPKFLPTSTLAGPPSSAYLKQFTMSNTSRSRKGSTENGSADITDFLKPLKTKFQETPKFCSSNTLQSPNGIGSIGVDLLKMTPRTPRLDLLINARFNPLAILGHDKENPLVLESPKLFKTQTIQNLQENQAHIQSKNETLKKNIQEEKSSHISETRVLKWYDYSSKYGIGYILSNNSLGVLFNDGTKMISKNEETFDYIIRTLDKKEIATTYKFKDYPQGIHKKVLVFNHFQEHFHESLKTIPEQDQTVYVKKWIKTKHAMFFRLNNHSLQLSFYDDSILLMNSDTKKLIFIDNKGNNFVFNIENASDSGNQDLIKRVKYAEEVLKHIWTAQADSDSNKIREKSAGASNV